MLFAIVLARSGDLDKAEYVLRKFHLNYTVSRRLNVTFEFRPFSMHALIDRLGALPEVQKEALHSLHALRIHKVKARLVFPV